MIVFRATSWTAWWRATDPVFTPGEERSAEDVPLFRVVLPLPADPHPDQIKAPAKHR